MLGQGAAELGHEIEQDGLAATLLACDPEMRAPGPYRLDDLRQDEDDVAGDHAEE